MAAPPSTPQEIASLIHVSNQGDSSGGWTLDVKTVSTDSIGDRLFFDITVSRGSGVWTSFYTTQRDGTLGKVYYCVDDQGRSWSPFLDGWR